MRQVIPSYVARDKIFFFYKCYDYMLSKKLNQQKCPYWGPCLGACWVHVWIWGICLDLRYMFGFWVHVVLIHTRAAIVQNNYTNTCI